MEQRQLLGMVYVVIVRRCGEEEKQLDGSLIFGGGGLTFRRTEGACDEDDG